MRMMTPLSIGLLLLLAATVVAQNQREIAVREDKKNIEADESWIYNELELGRAVAEAENKPLLVVIRCLP